MVCSPKQTLEGYTGLPKKAWAIEKLSVVRLFLDISAVALAKSWRKSCWRMTFSSLQVVHNVQATSETLLALKTCSWSHDPRYTSDDFSHYVSIIRKLKDIVMQTFSVSDLYFTAPTFITRLDGNTSWIYQKVFRRLWTKTACTNACCCRTTAGTMYRATATCAALARHRKSPVSMRRCYAHRTAIASPTKSS